MGVSGPLVFLVLHKCVVLDCGLAERLVILVSIVEVNESTPGRTWLLGSSIRFVYVEVLKRGLLGVGLLAVYLSGFE